MRILQITPTLNNSLNRTNNANISYTSRLNCVEAPSKQESKIFEPIKKFFKPLTDPCQKGYNNVIKTMAKGLGKILQNNSFKPILAKANKTKMVQHITCLGSIVLSGFYVKQTLQNDKLEKQRKTTLAINQAAVAIFSAIASYTIDNLLAKPGEKFANRFIAANPTNKKIGKYVDGIKCAQSMIVFGTVYRFIAPVLITPIANGIGNKIQAKKEAKLANQQINNK